jgi:hypothetical protein
MDRLLAVPSPYFATGPSLTLRDSRNAPPKIHLGIFPLDQEWGVHPSGPER